MGIPGLAQGNNGFICMTGSKAKVAVCFDHLLEREKCRRENPHCRYHVILRIRRSVVTFALWLLESATLVREA